MISIIIPIFNGQSYIDNFFERLIPQCNAETTEIIIIDDGSTDETLSKLKKIKNNYPNIINIISKNNGGVSSARNVGIRHSKGEYITFLDIDDLVLPEYIPTILDAVDDVTIDLGICGYYESVSGEITFERSKKCISDDLDSLLRSVVSYHGICSALWNKIFKSDVIKNNNIFFDEEISVGEDLLFITTYITYIRWWKEIPQILYEYRITSTSIMQNIRSNKKFNAGWLSEWASLKYAQKMILSESNIYKFDQNIFFEKKVRVALKLIRSIYRNDRFISIKVELKEFIVSNMGKIIFNRRIGKRDKLYSVKIFLLVFLSRNSIR